MTDDAPSDPGAVYSVQDGGELILAAPVAATSELIYGSSNTGGPGGTIVLENPGATITAAFDGINGGDVLELPGTKVVSLTTTGGVLKVVTDAGSFDFTNPSSTDLRLQRGGRYHDRSRDRSRRHHLSVHFQHRVIRRCRRQPLYVEQLV